MDNSKSASGQMKYCVVGNIVMEHPDKNGVIRYGTASFPGGRKVYISRRIWGSNVSACEVVVLGLNRHKSRYTIDSVPLAWIENIRFAKTFIPKVIELMENNEEYCDMWWRYKEEDRRGAAAYAQILSRIKAGDTATLEQYNRNVMAQFCYDYG